MKTYALDLLTLVESLGQQAALLNTPILDTLPGFVGPCRGWVQVQDGNIAMCVLEGVNGGCMEGEQALSLVRTVKAWQVTLDAAPPAAPVPVAPVAVRPPVLPSLDAVLQRSVPKRRVAALSPALLAPLSSKERVLLGMVFMMVNGRRGIEQIKAELHISAESIDHALRTLWTLQVIDYLPSSS